MRATRRGILASAIAAPFAATAAHVARPWPEVSTIAADLERYAGFGIKRAGGEGDQACGEWLAQALAGMGYRIERQAIEVPWFEPSVSEIAWGRQTLPVYPQPLIRSTGRGGIAGPLVPVDRNGRWRGAMRGAIAVLDLPNARWSSALAKPFREPVTAAFAAGAIAVVAITNGPSGEMIALNSDGRKPMFAGPVALVAPKAAGTLLAVAMDRQRARLTIDGQGGKRPAFNFVGRLDRGKGHWLAVSTPRSGWFTCAAERGGGVAVWLDLARWAITALPDHDLAFVCNTGHEYEYLGAAEALKVIAPPVGQTALWLHLGANLAARDWHELTTPMTALSSVDSQRYLSVTPDLLPLARQAFAGEAGFQDPVASDVLAAGELVEILAAGYRPAAGIFGIHRFHHTAPDDERCLLPSATQTAAIAFRNFVGHALKGQRA